MKNARMEYMDWRAHNDVHAHPARRMRLAECDCTQIDANEVQAGDFKYYYSDQLDAFTLYEVTAVDRIAGKCSLVEIDTDSPEVRGITVVKSLRPTHCDTYYRPDPQNRERVERTGFESKYIPLFPGMCRPIRRRQLHLRLYYTPPLAKAKGWLQRFFMF